MTPENVVEVVSPSVNVTDPETPLVTVPVPAKELTVSLNPFRSNVALSVNAVPLGTALVRPSFNVPALIVVAPVYVFAPPRIRVPVPDLVRARARVEPF